MAAKRSRAGATIVSAGKLYTALKTVAIDSVGRMRLRVLTFKIAKYYASRQEPSARTRFFVGKRPTRSRPPTSGLVEVKHGTLNARSFSDDAEYRAKMRRSIPISSASFSRDVTDAPRKAIS